MKRLKIVKAYAVLALFIYFLVYSNLEAMSIFFFATLTFNLAVLTILIIGIIVILKSTMNLVMLAGTFGILAHKKDNLTFYLQGIEKIMPANIAHMFHSRADKGVLIFTSEESRAVIEWINEKFSHQNRYINYFISTSLMIGLLGTFTGLLTSIDQMGKIILSLSGDIDLGEVIRGFAGPLGGMAVGFGSSLFGVVSAIILGIMGYILNKNQEQLIEGVEDWLKGRIIDSSGSTSETVTGNSATSELPEHRSSFMDVFIDNIASLTAEMAKISLTNERLHSITVASVQQTRNEHEDNFEVFESMNTNLLKITQILNSNSEQFIHILDNSLKERIDELRGELQDIASLLSKNGEIDEENTQNLVDSISDLSQKMQEETALLKSLEKLNKIQISDTRKQTVILESLEILNNTQVDDARKQTIILESLEMLNNTQVDDARKQTTIMKSLEMLSNTQIDDARKQTTILESLEMLNNTQVDDARKQTALMKSLEMLNNTQIDDARKQNAIMETVVENTAEERNSLLVEKIEDLEAFFKSQAQKQNKSLATQEDSKELLQKQKEILERLLGKNNENLSELKRISTGKAASGDITIKPRGFFSKIFG